MDSSNIKFVAFYLPQYHPIPENDKWWGKGFTEWINVVQAKPLFKGHYQPHIPADLGFYDLRLPEIRQAQADLAREHGIHGFCYYHYWFHGHRLLERPFNEVLDSGKPDFPFCLCWANENWMSRWDGHSGKVLMEQTYSHEDDLQHIKWLAKAFIDDRYMRVDDKPLFLVYRASQLPDPVHTTQIWREKCHNLGIGDIFLCKVESFLDEQGDPKELGFDAAVEFQPDWSRSGSLLRRELIGFVAKYKFLRSYAKKLSSLYYFVSGNRIYDYGTMVHTMLQKPDPHYIRFPCVNPSWDNTSRRQTGALIIHDSTPELFEKWMRGTEQKALQTLPTSPLIFINAWNEWAEGNHLEPCIRWGRAYLEAVKRVVESKRSNIITCTS